MKWEKLLLLLQSLMFGAPQAGEAAGEGSMQPQGRDNPSDLQALTLQHPKAPGHPGGEPSIDAIAKLKQHAAGFPQCITHNSWRDKEQAPQG